MLKLQECTAEVIEERQFDLQRTSWRNHLEHILMSLVVQISYQGLIRENEAFLSSLIFIPQCVHREVLFYIKTNQLLSENI